MPARCGVQKKSRNFALSGGGHARLCPLTGKSADLPVCRRAGNFMSNGAITEILRRFAVREI